MQNHRTTLTNNVPGHRAGSQGTIEKALPPIDPLTLARLNFGLFSSLRSLGTSRERICAALGLSATDFDYISMLAER